MFIMPGALAIACFWIASRYPQPDGTPHEAMTWWGWMFIILTIFAFILDVIKYKKGQR